MSLRRVCVLAITAGAVAAWTAAASNPAPPTAPKVCNDGVKTLGKDRLDRHQNLSSEELFRKCLTEGRLTHVHWTVTQPGGTKRTHAGATMPFDPHAGGTYVVVVNAVGPRGEPERATETIKIAYGQPTPAVKTATCTAPPGGTCPIVALGTAGTVDGTAKGTMTVFDATTHKSTTFTAPGIHSFPTVPHHTYDLANGTAKPATMTD